jgi:hypothetical protein
MPFTNVSEPLRNFTQAILASQIGWLDPRVCTIRDVGPILTVTLHRVRPFQAELVIVKPGGVGFPEHLHPNVDSFEVILGGDIVFTRNGVVEPLSLKWPEVRDRGALGALHIPHTDWHGATVGPAGAAFISCQHWLNGVTPTTVGADWEGAPLGPRHEAVWAAEGRTTAEGVPAYTAP